MGKKNKEKTVSAAMWGHANPKKFAELRERYGVSGAQGGKPSNYGPGSDQRTKEDVYNDIMDAARNDYDTRRGIEAAGLAGNKKAAKLSAGGFNNITDVAKAQNVLGKLKKKHVGGGGMGGAKNIMGLTDALVQHDRETQTAAYDEKYAKTTDLNSLKDKLMAQASEDAVSTPIEPSDRMAAVEERMESASYNSPPGLFDKDNADPAKADDQKDAAKNFLDDYKLDVAKGANIKSDIETGVSNAARHVRDTYGR